MITTSTVHQIISKIAKASTVKLNSKAVDSRETPRHQPQWTVIRTLADLKGKRIYFDRGNGKALGTIIDTRKDEAGLVWLLVQWTNAMHQKPVVINETQVISFYNMYTFVQPE